MRALVLGERISGFFLDRAEHGEVGCLMVSVVRFTFAEARYPQPEAPFSKPITA